MNAPPDIIFNRKNCNEIQAVYQIINKINNKRYIGSTNNLYGRFNAHKSRFLRNKHQNPYLSNSINKYGIETFEFKLIKIFVGYSQEEILKIENEYIKKYNSNNRKFGYNVRIDCRTNKGFKHSEETRKKISEAGMNRVFSIERKKKLSDAKMGSLNPKSRKVIDTKTHKVYDTITDAAAQNNIKTVTLHQYLNNKRRNKTNLKYLKP